MKSEVREVDTKGAQSQRIIRFYGPGHWSTPYFIKGGLLLLKHGDNTSSSPIGSANKWHQDDLHLARDAARTYAKGETL